MQSLTTALENLLRHLSQEIPATPGIRVIDIPFPLKDAFDALSWLASQQVYPQFYWQQRNGDEEAAVLGAITRFTSLDQAQRFLRQHPEHADLRIWGLNAFDPSQGNLLLPRLEWRRCGGGKQRYRAGRGAGRTSGKSGAHLCHRYQSIQV